MSQLKPRTIQFYGVKDIDRLPQLQQFSETGHLAMKAVAQVLPFRVNNYVVEELINWEKVPDHPIFRLTPKEEMLTP